MPRGSEGVFQGFLTSVHRVVGLAELSVGQFTNDAANRLRRIQIRGAIEQMRVFVVGNTFFAPVLAVQAWGSGIDTLVVIWTVVMLTFSWWLFFQWRKSYQTDGCKADMRRFTAETRVNAALWCSGMILFYPYVQGYEKTILTTIMAGSLALGTVGFSQAPPAAIWYLGIQTTTLTTVPIVYGAFWGTGSDLMIGALALIAGLAIFNAALERAREQVRAFVNHETLTQKSEVIDLLLKDYEEQVVEWVWRTDSAGNIISAPQQVLDLLAAKECSEQASNMLASIACNIDEAGAKDLAKISEAFAEQRDFHDVTLPLFSPSKGELRWIMMRGRPQFENDAFIGFRGIFADATTAVAAQKQVEFLAKHDPLTGTYNRNLVHTYLTDLKKSDDTAMVYLIDLDGFKQVNDSYGHSIGDMLLQRVAERLRKSIGKDDILARLGGDEFLIVTQSPNKFECLDDNALSNQLLVTLSKNFVINQYDIALSASIGTANFPQDTTDGPSLLNQADLALYAAKKGGRNRCVAFVESMQVGLQKRLMITDRLRHAVNTKQIVPHYQPQYCTQTGKIIGVESLARWNDPELGAVGPDIFIPIAEETGLIQELGNHMLRTACEDALKWPPNADGVALTVSVNVSPVQVTRGNLVESVADALEATGLAPEQLEIEVTEGVLIDDMIGTCDILRELSDLGVGIALDDFGTGYSSLSYIRALPLDRLKIDRSFIADIHELEAQSIVQTIIDLCRRLDLLVIAEGVETSEDVALLRSMGCDILQGYYYSRPVPSSEINGLIVAPKAAVG